MQIHSLSTLLAIRPASCVALIGGGGKTTLMLALAAELRAGGQRPVITTTTRIWPPGDLPLVLGDIAALRDALALSGVACFGQGATAEGKVAGIEPQLVCRLLADGMGPILVEADGAAGRPLKLHAAHEPVVPRCCTDLLMVAGIDAVGRPADERVIHRAGLAVDALGLRPDDPVAPEHVAAALIRMAAFAPPQARRWFVLNKVHDDAGVRTARATAAHLGGPPARCVMTSWGRITNPTPSPSAAGGDRA